LTGEHVVPDCFHKTIEAISIAKTPTGDKAIASAQEIRDVCAHCNNGPLSQLDNYLCKLNEKFLSTIVHAGDCVDFRYDFDRLLRVLLKIGYNVARTRNWPLANWQDAAQYILGRASCPKGYHLFLQLVIPTPAKRVRLPLTPGTREVTPLPWHANLNNVSHIAGLVFEYALSFWSYRFFILRGAGQDNRATRRRAVSLWLKAKDKNGTCELTDRNAATLYASSLTVMGALQGDPNFFDHLSKARSLKAVMLSKKDKQNTPD
jgi:hypothetical protein